VKEIPLTRGRVVVVDDEDFAALAAHRWCLWSNGKHEYAMREASGRTVLMHRVILGAEKGQVVDHKNHNGLDNRRENLRLCSSQQNNFNTRPLRGTSKYKGVSLEKRTGRWRAFIRVSYKKVALGYFASEVEAAAAYDRAAREHHGQFAYTNGVG